MHIAGELFCSGHLISATNLKTAVWSSLRTSSQVQRSRSSFRTTCTLHRVAQICILFWSIWCRYLISYFLIICQFWNLSPHDWWQQRPAERQRLVGGLLWCGLWEEPQGFQLLEEQVQLQLIFVNGFFGPLKCFGFLFQSVYFKFQWSKKKKNNLKMLISSSFFFFSQINSFGLKK